MKSKWSIVVILAAVLLALAFAGASWGGASAQTVPPEPPSPAGFGSFLGAQGVYNSSGFGQVSVNHCAPQSTLFLRQPICVEFNPEGIYVYVVFTLNDAEMEMMDAGELCVGYVGPWQTYPLNNSTTPGQVYAYVPGFSGQYGLTTCP